MQIKSSQRGFTVMLAALVSSIVLSLGASIYQLASKELLLSSLGRESQYAFFAADTGAECALYWDSRYAVFDTVAPATPPGSTPQCDGQAFTPAGSRSAYPYTLSFQFQPGGYCTIVTVEKCDGPIAIDGTCTSAVPAVIHTLIHADGYSGSCSTYTTSARSLQRSVELRY